MGSLVWLFKEYRDLYQEVLRLRYDTAQYERKLEDLEKQLANKAPITIDNLKEMAEELFQDQPYEGGTIPDNVWLTPGENDRPVR